MKQKELSAREQTLAWALKFMFDYESKHKKVNKQFWNKVLFDKDTTQE